MAAFEGTVKWFNGQKGFGFIARADGSEEVFVHQSSLLMEGFRTLREGATVQFKLSSEERPSASDVIVVQEGPPRKRRAKPPKEGASRAPTEKAAGARSIHLDVFGPALAQPN